MANEYKPLPHEKEEWQGYTLEELRYQRAVASARLEIQKERIAEQVRRIRAGYGQSSGIASRLFSSLNYVDYGILAFKLIKRVSSAVHSLRGRRG